MFCSCGVRMNCLFTIPVGSHSRYRWYQCKCKGEEQEMLDVPAEALADKGVSTDRGKMLLFEGRAKRRNGRHAGRIKRGESKPSP